jgi:hypothetical protein
MLSVGNLPIIFELNGTFARVPKLDVSAVFLVLEIVERNGSSDVPPSSDLAGWF